jgi:hypothetical protein
MFARDDGEHTRRAGESGRSIRETGLAAWIRGRHGNLENTLAIHDWETVMKSPIVVGGLKREGDKVRVSGSESHGGS